VGTAAALLVLQRKKEPAKDKDSVALQLVPSMPLSRQDPLGASLLGTF
jgi:hypothetical protein